MLSLATKLVLRSESPICFHFFAAHVEHVTYVAHALAKLVLICARFRLEQIEELGTKTMDELEFVKFLEAGGAKRGADANEDEEAPKPSKAKKSKA